jgi:hypothetical protein
MTTLNTTNAICVSHKPNKKAISFWNDVAYTFCMECENNIESYWMDFDSDRLSMWSDWKVSN